MRPRYGVLMRTLSVLFLALVACGGPKTAPATTEAGASLHGTPPAQPVVLPEFAAMNHLGQPRTREDLLGKPTVLWFFPAAGTPG